MQKNYLIGVSIFAMVLLVLGSLTNVVGYQAVQSSNQKLLKDEIDQKELLFQTIIDIVNNKEIQNIIQKYEIKSSLINSLHKPGLILSLMKSRTPFKISSLSSFLTKNFLEYTYRMGVKLSMTIDVSKMHSIIQRYQMSNQEVQKEISTVIENNANLKAEITQLSSLNCDCEKNNAMNWSFPVICNILAFIFVIVWELWFIVALGLHKIPVILDALLAIIVNIAIKLNCWWY